MGDLLSRANENRKHVEHSAPEDTAAVLADIDACLGIKTAEEEDSAASVV